MWGAVTSVCVVALLFSFAFVEGRVSEVMAGGGDECDAFVRRC